MAEIIFSVVAQIMAGVAVTLCTLASFVSVQFGNTKTAFLNAALAMANAGIFFYLGAMR